MSRDVKTKFTKTKIKYFKEMLDSAKLSNQYLESILNWTTPLQTYGDPFLNSLERSRKTGEL